MGYTEFTATAPLEETNSAVVAALVEMRGVAKKHETNSIQFSIGSTSGVANLSQNPDLSTSIKVSTGFSHTGIAVIIAILLFPIGLVIALIWNAAANVGGNHDRLVASIKTNLGGQPAVSLVLDKSVDEQSPWTSDNCPKCGKLMNDTGLRRYCLSDNILIHKATGFNIHANPTTPRERLLDEPVKISGKKGDHYMSLGKDSLFFTDENGKTTLAIPLHSVKAVSVVDGNAALELTTPSARFLIQTKNAEVWKEALDPRCGRASLSVPSGRGAMAMESRLCTNCGNALRQSQRFCAKCGAAQS